MHINVYTCGVSRVFFFFEGNFLKRKTGFFSQIKTVTFKFSGLQGWLSMSRAVNPIPKHCLLKAKITKIDKSTFIAICIDFDSGYRKNIQEVLYLQIRVYWTSLFFQVFAHINKTYVHCINFHAILIPTGSLNLKCAKVLAWITYLYHPVS